MSASDYVANAITPSLAPALVALCRARPKDPVSWLAKYLLDNKPQPELFSVTEAFKEAVIRVFYMADEDGSGSLEWQEVCTIAESNQEVMAIMTTLDKDKDGTISLEEWVDFFMAVFASNRPVAEFILEKSAYLIFERQFMLLCRDLFMEFDKDGSGQLEMQEVLMAIGDDAQGADFVKFADVNNDGVLSLEEWMVFFFSFWRAAPAVARANVAFLQEQAAALRMMPAMPPAQMDKQLAEAISTPEGMAELKALFETLDKDGDGNITSKEWGKAVSKNKKALSKFFGGASPKEIGMQFKRIDADGSGDLTWDEFVDGVKKLADSYD